MGVLLTLAIPSSAQAKPSDKPQTEQNGSPGGSADKDQKAEKSDKKDVDTEHLFGFTEGADAGEKGEQEVVIDTVTRVSKRRDGPGPSTYRVLDTRFAYQFNPIDKLSIEFSAFGTLRRQRNIVDLDDKSYGTFDGVSMEVKYQFLKGTKKQPLGLALEVRPRFTRILPVEGNGANIFDLESLLQLDVQVVPDKLWYGSNISFEPAAGRQRGGGPGDLTGWLWTGLIERISQDRRSRTCGEDRRRARSRSF
ncbi:hypothetical protein [Methylorubrum extorquens]|uniref:hypothetical protein n=1 Tax=Methylorubrum extorquens TaxID=408 RepID=UPI001FD8751E|nr:hypothetical protein [Methylorubrum extorquens]